MKRSSDWNITDRILFPLALSLLLASAGCGDGDGGFGLGDASTDADADADSDSDSDADTDTDSDGDSDADTDTDSDADTDTDTDADTDSDTDADADADGDGDTDLPECTDQDSDGWCLPLDCDDAVPGVNPGEWEVPDNGVDDDCDGITDETTHIDLGLPSDVALSFQGTVDPARAPTILYPPDGVLLPLNLSDVMFQWNAGPGNDLWKVEFDGTHADATAYVTTNWYVPDGSVWDVLRFGNASETVEVTISGTSSADTSVQGTSQSVTIGFAEDTVNGGLYYWAASSIDPGAPYGIMRYDFGNPGQSAESAYSTIQTAGRCVACHALHPTGTHMALNYDGGNGQADIIDIAAQTSSVPSGNEYFANFHTYSPDGQYVLSVFHGVFTLRDGVTGAVVETLSDSYVTYPDWSADGTKVAFTRCTRPLEGFNDWTFHGGQIEIMTYGGPGNWGAPQVLVPAEANTNLYYPAISPDGEWVLFNRSSDLGGYPSPGDSYSDDDAELWVVAIDGGTPIRLDAVDLVGNLRTSWAKWCPEQHVLDGKALLWLTVSSMRDYGHQLQGVFRPQIWMAGFDPERAGDGLDPTWPAFYLPFQDITTNNHIPQWTSTVVPID